MGLLRDRPTQYCEAANNLKVDIRRLIKNREFHRSHLQVVYDRQTQSIHKINYTQNKNSHSSRVVNKIPYLNDNNCMQVVIAYYRFTQTSKLR